MNRYLEQIVSRLKEQGLSPGQEEALVRELHDPAGHNLPDEVPAAQTLPGFYAYGDFACLQAMAEPTGSYTTRIRSLDELLERDKQRVQDGFPRKIRIGRLIRPGKGGKDKIVVIPTTAEEKFIHDQVLRPPGEAGPSGGSGEGEEGEVIGEQPVRSEQEAGSGGAGQGNGDSHELESSAYDLGKILTEKFELPNLKEKRKKSSLTRYTYDLTDKNRGFGQILDKKATLRRILESNIGLGNIPDLYDIDTTRFLISPRDKVYRILSRELDYESQAMVFFLRDYSGSMAGQATELVASQHVLIYSWLLYQFERQVECRFILHDDEAREVPDFHTYYNLRVAGGTKVAAAYRLVNEIVEKENLAKDYNIYVFHGTDGDDWDSDGSQALPELKNMLTYANRIGITVTEHTYSAGNSDVVRYLNNSRLLDEKPDLLRLDVMGEDADEPRLIEGIKRLIS